MSVLPSDLEGAPSPGSDAAFWADAEEQFAQIPTLGEGSASDKMVGLACHRVVALGRVAAASTARQVLAIGQAVQVAEQNPQAYVGIRALDEARSTAAYRKDVEFARRAVIAELAVCLHVSESAVTGYVHTAEVLDDDLPATKSAFEAGCIEYPKVRSIVETAGALPQPGRLVDDPEAAEAAREGLRRLDEIAAQAAQTLTPSKLRQKLRGLRERLHTESLTARHRQAVTERRVWVQAEQDGMAWLGALLPAEQAMACWGKIDAAARDLAGGSGEQRTLDQLRADALGDLLSGDLTPGELLAGEPAGQGAGPVRASVHVTVPVSVLIEGIEQDRHHDGLSPTSTMMSASSALTPAGSTPCIEPAILDGYGPIDPLTAARLTAGAPSLYRILTDPISGAVLTADRASYRPPADLKRLVTARFPTCVFPGCTRPSRTGGVDIDHSQDWDHGGTTAVQNLAPLCRHHHRIKHHTLWTLDRDSHGGITWTDPTGTQHDTDPPPF